MASASHPAVLILLYLSVSLFPQDGARHETLAIDRYLSKYAATYGVLQDVRVLEAQVMQESGFDETMVNRENPCNSAIAQPWSLGPLQINRGCNPWFSSNSDGSFNDSLWRNPNYYFNATIRDWASLYMHYVTLYPGCTPQVYLDWTVAGWNAGPPPFGYSGCGSKPYDPRGYLAAVELNEAILAGAHGSSCLNWRHAKVIENCVTTSSMRTVRTKKE